MTTLDDMLALRSVSEDALVVHKKQMMAEVRAHRLRELREQAGNTRAELAERSNAGRLGQQA